MESLSITERITNLPSIDYASSNVTPLSIDGEQLNQLRVQIETLLSETYRFERIIYALAYGLIVVISFFGNLLVCRVCMRNMTKTNALIMSLAASDLLMTLFNIPFNFFRLLNYSWPFGSLMCFIVNFVQHLVVYISSYTMAVIAIQRYRSVCGFHYQLVNGNIKNGERTETNSSDADLTSKQPAKVYKCCTTCLSFVIGLITCQFLERMCIPRTQRIYSMRTIFIAIVVVWICSAFVSALFTYSSSVVEREDFFSTILWNLYDVNSTKINTFNKTVNDAIGYGIESTELDSPEFNNNIETSIHVVFRCQNPLPHGVDSFFKQYSIKADLAKTVVIFVTQYFIPLAVSCGCYVRIGKIITQQGKIATIRGNPKARIRQKKKRRRILVLVLVCASFAICWLPIHLFHLLTDAGLFNYNYQIFMMVHWLAMSSVSVNSFIYCWKDKNFRKAAVRVFCCFGTDNMSTPGRNNVIQDGQNRSNSNIRNGGKVRKLNLSVSCCERKSNEPNHNEMDEERRESTPLHPLPPLSSTSNVFGHKQSNVSMVTESSLVVFSSNGSVERLVDPTTKTIINNDNNTDVGGNVNQMNVPNRVVMKQRKQFKLFSWANKFPIHYSTGVRTNSPITMALTTTTTTPIVLDNPCQINVEECNDTVDIDFEHRKRLVQFDFVHKLNHEQSIENDSIEEKKEKGDDEYEDDDDDDDDDDDEQDSSVEEGILCDNENYSQKWNMIELQPYDDSNRMNQNIMSTTDRYGKSSTLVNIINSELYSQSVDADESNGKMNTILTTNL